MSLNFLGKKSFHPSAPQNVRKLFIAEEKRDNEARKAEELKREAEEEETRRHARKLLHGSQKEPTEGMAFMYSAPPGLKEAQSKQSKQTAADRDAERFPILKDAPRQGEYSLNMDVQHQPFGVMLRKTKCSRCGNWGHQNGDRECPLRNESSTSDSARKSTDDPLANRIAGAETSGAALRWAPKAAPDAGRLGSGVSADDANQQFVAGDEDEHVASLDAMAAAGVGELNPSVLAMLSEKQRRKLLKMCRKELRGLEGGGDEPRERKRKRKHKHKDRKHESKHEKSHRRHKSSSGHGKQRADDAGSGSQTSSDSESR